MNKVLSAVISLSYVLFCGGAFADTAITTLNVQTTVNISCSVLADPLVFAYDPQISDSHATSRITVNCSTDGTTVDVALDAGTGYVSGTSRNMTAGGTNQTPYWLYQDSSEAVEWGDSDYANTYPAGSSQSTTIVGGTAVLTVYGMAIFDPNAPSGQYKDFVLVTANF